MSFLSDAVNGRRDFDNTPQTLVMTAGVDTIDQRVIIPVIDDRINEANEGLMLIVRATKNSSDALDVANLEYIDEGVTLLRITDDDRMFTITV